MDETFDCIVVGGGAAGLSATLVLGRARRRTLLLDAGGQSNRAAAGIGGMLGQDGRPPADFYALGGDELARYPAVATRPIAATGARHAAEGFELTLGDGATVRGRTLLLASGSDYEPPDLPGVAERWGGTVFHCPFCHGWEVRERPLAMLGRDPHDAVRALLLTAWSDDVALLTGGGPAGYDGATAARLEAAGVAVDERPIAALRGPGAELEAVVFEDGAERACGGLMVAARLHGRTAIAEALGAELGGPHPVFAASVAVDGMFRTTVPGLFAAGDVAGEMPSVANAVAAGSKAAGTIVHDLTCGAPDGR
jgi:thioredoxin reductase